MDRYRDQDLKGFLEPLQIRYSSFFLLLDESFCCSQQYVFSAVFRNQDILLLFHSFVVVVSSYIYIQFCYTSPYRFRNSSFS